MNDKSQLQFKIAGMDCAEEVTILKRAVGPVVGGEDKLAFDILNAKMTVQASADLQSEEVVAAVGRTGMRSERWSREPADVDEGGLWRNQGRTLTTILSGVFLARYRAIRWCRDILSRGCGASISNSNSPFSWTLKAVPLCARKSVLSLLEDLPARLTCMGDSL